MVSGVTASAIFSRSIARFAFRGTGYRFPPHPSNHQPVKEKRRLGHDRFATRSHKRPDYQLYQFIRTVAEHNAVERNAIFFGKFFSQIKTASVRIAVQFGQSCTNRLDCPWRWAKRIFIAGKLYGAADSVFAFQFFDWFAGRIGSDARDMFRCAGFHVRLLSQQSLLIY